MLRVNVLVSIGTIDLLTFYGKPLGQLYPVVLLSVAAMWVAVTSVSASKPGSVSARLPVLITASVWG